MAELQEMGKRLTNPVKWDKLSRVKHFAQHFLKLL